MCEHEYRERKERSIHFKENVPEAILVVFLEWAYTKDYADQATCRPLDANIRLASQAVGSLDLVETSINNVASRVEIGLELQVQEEGMASDDIDNEEEMHPLLLHIRLYIFGDEFLIPKLRARAKEKTINQLKAIASLDHEYEREAVLDLLEYTFSNLREEDLFLLWLGMFASYRLDKLKQSSARLCNLLGSSGGSFARHLIRFVNSTPHAPWDRQENIIPIYPIPYVR